jgi:endonuclease III
MINPDRITKFHQTVPELEEVLLFWIAVAGKTAVVIAKRIEAVLAELDKRYPGNETPFAKIRAVPLEELTELLRTSGVGCFKSKARSMKEVAGSNIDLQTCTVDELEAFHGIGPKTARCFLIHSRPDVRYAGLDTHVMKWLHHYRCVPEHLFPTSSARYRDIEQVFLSIADRANLTPAKLDLVIWRQYRRDLVAAANKPVATCS